MTSILQQLPQIDLAIQRSRHPVAQWAVEFAKPNDTVAIRVGGSYTYDRKQQQQQQHNRLFFFAGGVGVNPPFSMLQQWCLDIANDDTSRAVLLYSAARHQDFLFVDRLEEMVKRMPDQLQVVLTTTKESNSLLSGREAANLKPNNGRIDGVMVQDAVGWLNRREDSSQQTKVLPETDSSLISGVYTCGPPGMPEAIAELVKPYTNEGDVHFEKWW